MSDRTETAIVRCPECGLPVIAAVTSGTLDAPLTVIAPVSDRPTTATVAAARRIENYLDHLAARSRRPQQDDDLAARIDGPGGYRDLTVADLKVALAALVETERETIDE